MSLRLKAPHITLAEHASIYVIFNKVFHASGMEDVRAGTGSLRYNGASKLVQAKAALPTISAILGHAHGDLTNVYLSVDTGRHRSGILPLSVAESGGANLNSPVCLRRNYGCFLRSRNAWVALAHRVSTTCSALMPTSRNLTRVPLTSKLSKDACASKSHPNQGPTHHRCHTSGILVVGFAPT